MGTLSHELPGRGRCRYVPRAAATGPSAARLAELMRQGLAWFAIVCVLMPACARHSVPPIAAGGQPFKPESDERVLWARAEKEEEALLKKSKTYDDPMLEEYLARIGDRLRPDEVRGAGGPGFKFAVLRDPTLNA